MRRSSRRPGLLRVMVLAVTVVFAALALVVGQEATGEVITPVVGTPSPKTYVADSTVTVEDRAATAAAQEAARLGVQTVYRVDSTVDNEVDRSIRAFFQRARLEAEPPEPLFPPLPDTTLVPSTTQPPETTVPPEGEGTGDTTADGETTGTGEGAAGGEDPGAAGEATGDEPVDEVTTTVAETTTTTSTTTTTIPRPPIEDQTVDLADAYPQFRPQTIDIVVKILNDDFDRATRGERQYFIEVEEEALSTANQTMSDEGGILSTQLADVKADLLRAPPFVLLPGLPAADRAAAQEAIADIVAGFLLPNRFRDDPATEAQREAAAVAVAPLLVDYVVGENIVIEGVLVTDVHLDAISQLGLIEPEEQPRLSAMAVVAALAILLSTFFLWRVAPQQWERPKLVTLFGLLVVLAAASARLPELLPADRPELDFLLPAVVFGFVAAILFDPRTAAVMAVPLGAFTALATHDLGLTVFAVGAAMIPVPFVSSAASRTELRIAVFTAALVSAPYAGAIFWFFNGFDEAWKASLVGFVSGAASGIITLGLLPFLENMFRITTTLTLLDLTDRNHPALRLIEEEAPGTFNHSIMVGTLAGKAARAIDANPLLAQAAAYYHDLGKTVQPQYYIENQFGVSNPHDDMAPEDSAEVLRSHVREGLRLARSFGIPQEVATGILQHHGTGLMRYFFHKALEQDSDVDPMPFRHTGEKPKGKEMAILMLSDAVEGATRALVQHEDPTSAGLRKVVNQVVAEKFDDGQLDESSLTFGELTRVKDALVEALIGYYHTRIPYPGFPEPRRVASIG